MQERSLRSSSRDRRGASSRSSGYSSQRSQRRNGSLGSSSRRRSSDSFSSSRSVSNSARRLRSESQDRDRNARNRIREERARVPQGGYALRNRNINFAGKRSNYNPQVILVGGIAVAIIVLLIFFIVSCAASCGTEQVDPTASISESLQGELRTSVEKLVTSDYQSTYVAENADLYPQDLIQLMIDEPQSTEFVFNYPTSSHEAQPYNDPVSAGDVPLLYNWDARWGYVDYAGSSLAVTGSGPTSLAMARMGLLGNAEMTPATIASQVTQLGGANGASFMAATLFGDPTASSTSSSKSSASDVTDENGDGYDDVTGEYVGDATSTTDSSSDSDSSSSSSSSQKTTSSSSSSANQLYNALGLSGEMITVEPGTSITDTLTDAIEDKSYVLVETTEGAFGSTPHWCLIVGANDDGSLTIYDPTSVANSLHPWDPSSVIDGSSALVALNTPQTQSQKKDEGTDEDGDGYDDNTGEYLGDTSSSSSGTSDSTSTSSDSSDSSGSDSSYGTSSSSGSSDSSSTGTSGTSTSSGTSSSQGTSSSSGSSSTSGTSGSNSSGTNSSSSTSDSSGTSG